MTSPVPCAGVRVSGYYKGWQCGAQGDRLIWRKKAYCPAHYLVAKNCPDKFDKARLCAAKQQERTERKQAAEAAITRAQDDWLDHSAD